MSFLPPLEMRPSSIAPNPVVFFNDVQTREEQNQMDCVSLKKKTPSDPGADLLRARSDLRVCVDTNHPRSWNLQ